jgi:hypothetical protein
MRFKALVVLNGSARLGVLFLFCFFLLAACQRDISKPSIEFTLLPPAGQGSADLLDTIGGRVTGARPGQRIVLFARSGVWWVQPLASRPFT